MTGKATRELAAVSDLAAKLPEWQRQVGPGLDGLMQLIMKMVHEIDDAAHKASPDDSDDQAQEAAGFAAFRKRLASGYKLPSDILKMKQKRVAALGHEKAASQLAYDIKTVKLLAEDFQSWYDAHGIGGVFRSLNEMRRIYDIGHDETAAMYSDDLGANLFSPSFRLREAYGKIEPAMLEALDMLAKEGLFKEAA